MSTKYRSDWTEPRNFSKIIIQTWQTLPMKTNNTFREVIIKIYRNVISISCVSLYVYISLFLIQ
jgi:hypothetical protein